MIEIINELNSTEMTISHVRFSLTNIKAYKQRHFKFLTMMCLIYDIQHNDIELVCIANKSQRYDFNPICDLSKKYSRYHHGYTINRNSNCICNATILILIFHCFGVLAYWRLIFVHCLYFLDFLRFSVTFDNVNDLLNGLNKFVSIIEKGNVIKCLLPNGV